ncbi:hypothetical protein [Edaphobacter albus]|uniref:hypothetical protein n=1 Tax=Edaphobacter sp. 4G125 TaxID=2763071 RepID=UPI001645F5CF|nr:hypothetical protein [Edaphobacter sp. 4G125]QNI36025.1 hypothetical protein H7846_13595 [Edaphobacter sp. 4G125]
METKLKRFQLFIKLWSIASLVLFTTLLIAFTLRAPVIDLGGSMHWAIWDEVNGHVGPMLFVIYITWAIFLIKASADPWRNALFFDFTMWANLAHGLLMAIQMAYSHHDAWKMLTDVPWVLALSAGIAWLRPNYNNAERPMKVQHAEN